MSREALSDLVRACERSPSLRRALNATVTTGEWLQVARDHGFDVKAIDLDQDDLNSRVDAWFAKSRMSQSFRSSN